MNALTDLTAEFVAAEDQSGPPLAQVRQGRWFSSQAIPRKLTIIYSVQLALAVATGVIGWVGLRNVEARLAAISPEMDAQIASQISTTEYAILGVVLLAFILGMYALKRLSGEISEVIAELARATTAIGDGHLDTPVPGLDRVDESGAMARSIEKLRRSSLVLRKLQAEEFERAQAELARRELDVSEREAAREAQQQTIVGIASKFDRSVGEIVTSVAAAASELQATATAMAANAEQSSNQSERVSEALAEASAGVTAAAAASEEFALSIGEISRQASTSAELARKANGAALDADKTISELTDSATEIGKVVELISHIAQRTNLLALNASIEAARGGEAGRGFAVVAAEVKELATQTGKATEQVAAQIRSMQETTGASVGALKDIGKQIKQLESTAISIAAAVDQQSKAGQDLARSIDLAARGAEEVTSSISQVRQASRATGNVASQVLSSATELETQATHLSAMAGEFIAQVRQS